VIELPLVELGGEFPHCSSATVGAPLGVATFLDEAPGARG
jgi:hypothetical protein